MADKPDPTGDFSLEELDTAVYPMVTEEVDTPESGSGRVSAADRDKASTATEEHGSFLLRDSFGGQGQSK